ncbi:restriction endonuclease [Dokdonella sp.]|uniref:restriction endonuclease n=1 Tax=Dokdonella sp. TaxID=2291710 RepID=UPI003782DB43
MPLKFNRTRRDDALSRVDPTRFEALVADHYRAQGWSVEHVGADATGRSYDGGIDLKLRRGHDYFIVQCKRWNAYKVTHNAVHELIGVMVTHGATGAVLVTCGEFTQAALAAASRQLNLQLVDGATVREWIDLAALEAELPAQTLKDSGTRDDWSDAIRANAPNRRTRRSSDKDRSAVILAAAGIAVLWGFVLLLPSRPVDSASTQAAHAATVRGASVDAQTAATHGVVPPAPPVPASPVPARAGRLTTAAQPIMRASSQFLREASVPDVTRPVDHEAARMAAKAVPGVRTALWLDRENFVVMVDGSQYRSMAMIDQVCVALEPLGDTLGVVVHVQDVTAQHADGATTLSRNCQLPEGQRAFLQRKRQVDVVPPEVRARFKDQQASK